jgi:hypothetical protein
MVGALDLKFANDSKDMQASAGKTVPVESVREIQALPALLRGAPR